MFVLAALLLLCLLPVAACQVQLQFTIAASPLGHAVASSATDQGTLVLARLRTRKALQAQQRAQGGFRTAGGGPLPDEADGGPVYECTSLDGPSCPWLSGDDDDLSDSAATVQRLLRQLIQKTAQQQQQQQSAAPGTESEPADAASVAQSGDAASEQPTAASADAPQSLKLEELIQHLLRGAPTAPQSQSPDAAADSDSAEPPLTAESSEAAQTMFLDDGEDGLDVEIGGAGGAAETEYELLTVGEDGETRPMTHAEMQVFTQEILAGNVHIEYEQDEDDDDEDAEEDGEDEERGSDERGEDQDEGQTSGHASGEDGQNP